MISPEWVEAGPLDWHNLVGTGPFMLTNYVDGSYAEYERNPNYRGTTIIDGKEYQTPLIDKLVYPLMVEDSVRLAALRTGKLDIWEDVPWVYEGTLAATSPELRSWYTSPFGAFRIGIRQDIGPPFDILEVRRAMAMAIDKQAIIDELYGGYGILVNYPFCANWGEEIYTPLEKMPKAVRELYDYKPEEAKRLLAEAGYADGFDAEVLIATVPIQTDIMSMVKAYWADIGIDLEIVAVDAVIQRAMTAKSGVGEQKEHKQMNFVLESAPEPGADITNSWLPWTLCNYSMCDDPHINAEFARWNTVMPQDETDALMKDLQVYIHGQVYDIFIPAAGVFVYAWPWVKHYEGEKMSGYLTSAPTHAIVWIDQDMKKEMGY